MENTWKKIDDKNIPLDCCLLKCAWINMVWGENTVLLVTVFFCYFCWWNQISFCAPNFKHFFIYQINCDSLLLWPGYKHCNLNNFSYQRSIYNFTTGFMTLKLKHIQQMNSKINQFFFQIICKFKIPQNKIKMYWHCNSWTLLGLCIYLLFALIFIQCTNTIVAEK